MRPLLSRALLGISRAAWLAFASSAIGVEPTPEANPRRLNTTADNSKFKELQKIFQSGPELTNACLARRTEAARQIQYNQHNLLRWLTYLAILPMRSPLIQMTSAKIVDHEPTAAPVV